ncbi:MAG: dynamin family protein [Clostridium sp.]|nr:dynamin family protein [Clostridium sp.]
MRRIKNSNFFSTPAPEAAPEAPKAAAGTAGQEKGETAPEPRKPAAIEIRAKIKNAVDTTGNALEKMGFKSLANEVARAWQSVRRERFSIAVVGEFNRGKSSMINRLVDREALPLGMLPTTTMLTRVRYGSPEKLIVVNKDGRKVADTTLSLAAWEPFKTAEGEGSGAAADGQAYVTVNDTWLRRTGIEIIDTPGAGDLDDSRARVIGQALMGCDGALITISATSPMSMTERVFMEQRIISRRIPYVALVITRIDQIPERERERLVEFVKQRLKVWGHDVPVLVAGASDSLPEKYSAICGDDRIRELMTSWSRDTSRGQLIELWLAGRLLETIKSARGALEAQLEVLDASDDRRRQLAQEKINELTAQNSRWQKLRAEMNNRADVCEHKVLAKASELAENLVEQLQVEISGVGDIPKWLNEIYPYRIKVQLANISSAIDNYANQQIQADMRWLATQISSEFKGARFEGVTLPEHVRPNEEEIAPDVRQKPEVENLEKKRIKRQVLTAATTAAVTIALACTTGGLGILGTLGFGTTAGIFNQQFFKKKIEEQRQEVKGYIATRVPEIIREASADAGLRLRTIYNNIASESFTSESAWTDAQRKAIIAAARDENTEQRRAAVKQNLEGLGKIENHINALTESIK